MIIIRLKNREDTNKVVNELSSLGLKAKVTGWKEKLSYFTEIVSSFDIIRIISFIIGIVISAVSIYIILYINILNKRVQIGIMKAIGVNSEVISLSYIMQAIFYGVIGSIAGIFLTLLMVQYFTFNPINTPIAKITPMISLGNIVFVVFSTIIISILSGYLVSRRVTKQHILQSISNA
jgi:putative ABC transport system permease protein